MPQIINPSPAFESDIKRFHMPGVILKDKCQNCGKDCEFDFGERSVSHPKFNGTDKVFMYCDSCGHEWQVEVIISCVVSIPKRKPDDGHRIPASDYAEDSGQQ